MQKFYKPSELPKLYQDHYNEDIQSSKPIIVYLKTGDIRLVFVVKFNDSNEILWRTYDSEQFEIKIKSIDYWTYAPEKPSTELANIIYKTIYKKQLKHSLEGVIRNCRYRIFSKQSDSDAKGQLHLACNDSFDRWANSKSITIDYDILFREDKVDLYNAVENLVAIFDR